MQHHIRQIDIRELVAVKDPRCRRPPSPLRELRVRSYCAQLLVVTPLSRAPFRNRVGVAIQTVGLFAVVLFTVSLELVFWVSPA